MLQLTGLALEECKSHLTLSKAKGSAVESYLVQYLLVLLCAETQKVMYEVVSRRGKGVEDKRVVQFLSIAAPKMLRSVKKDELGNFLACFGDDLKASFSKSLESSEIEQYNSAVSQRHEAAHPTRNIGAAKQWTLDDFERIWPIAQKVVKQAVDLLEADAAR